MPLRDKSLLCRCEHLRSQVLARSSRAAAYLSPTEPCFFVSLSPEWLTSWDIFNMISLVFIFVYVFDINQRDAGNKSLPPPGRTVCPARRAGK